MMTIRFESPTEAFAAVATVVVATDKLGSMKEKDFLFKQAKRLDIFENYDQVQFTKLLGDTVEKIYTTLPMEGISITTQGVESLIQAVKEVLSPELRVEAFRMAVGLAGADEACGEETALLEQLRRGLEVDDRVAQDILKSETGGR